MLDDRKHDVHMIGHKGGRGGVRAVEGSAGPGSDQKLVA